MDAGASHWLTKALIRRFGGRERCTVFEKLAAIRQHGSVEDYIQEFERLVAQATELTEEQLLGYFYAGLQGNIRSQIRPHNPRELLRAMDIAREVEELTADPRQNRGRSIGELNFLEDIKEGLGLCPEQRRTKGEKVDRTLRVT